MRLSGFQCLCRCREGRPADSQSHGRSALEASFDFSPAKISDHQKTRVVQRAGVVGQMDFDVVRIHHAVAVDVDLQRRIGAGPVHPGLGMRRRRRPVERCHELNRAGEFVRIGEGELVARGIEVDDGVAVVGWGFGGAGEVEVVGRGACHDRVGLTAGTDLTFLAIRGHATEQVRAACSVTTSSRVKGGRLLSTEHPEKLLSRALSAKEWGLRIYTEEKSSFDIFTTNLGSGVRISSGVRRSLPGHR